MWKRSAQLKFCVGLLIASAVALDSRGAGISTGNSLSELEGKWTLVKAEMMGKPLLPADQPAPEITVKDGKLTTDFKRAPPEPIELTKVLDPSASPKLITLPVERRIMFYGIYEVKGSELRICGDAGLARRSSRPKDFNDQDIVFVFKRAN